MRISDEALRAGYEPRAGDPGLPPWHISYLTTGFPGPAYYAIQRNGPAGFEEAVRFYADDYGVAQRICRAFNGKVP